MENAKQVGRQALHYRIATNEIVGIISTLALTAIIAIILFLIKLKNGVAIDVVVFMTIIVLLVVIIYFISLMQYKNLKYNLGQNAITFQRGSFSVESETIPFEKIKNSTFDQSLIQRIFSVGDITIDQEDEKYIWEDIDTATATLISNAVSAKGDVQPITVSEANAVINPSQQN